MSSQCLIVLYQRLCYSLLGVVSLLPLASHAATSAATTITTTNTALTAYKVQKGDTLRGVANKFNLTVNDLAKYNNKKITDKLVMDEVLLLSGDDVAKVVSKIKPDALKYVSSNATTATTTSTYSVKSGETLNGIANRNNTTPSEILRLNNLTPDTKLAIGQKLQLPVTTKVAEKTTVKTAEKPTPKAVIKTPAADTKIADTKADQKTEKKPEVKPPVKATETKPRAAVKISEYKVVSGDSLGKLSVRYNIALTDLTKMNHLKPTDSLKIGQTVLVPIAVLNP